MRNMTVKRTLKVPMVALRGIVILPHMLTHFDMIRKKSILALEEAMKLDQSVFLGMQREIEIEDPKISDIEHVGTLAKVKQVVKLPKGVVRVLVEGTERAALDEIISSEPYNTALVSQLDCEDDYITDELVTEAYKRKLLDGFDNYADINRKIDFDTVIKIENDTSLSVISDIVAAAVPMKNEDRQALLNEFSGIERTKLLIEIIARETELMKIELEINKNLKLRIDKNQREYFLREQIKVIEDELGDADDSEREITDFTNKLIKTGAPQNVVEKCEREFKKLRKMQTTNPEAGVIRNYLSWITELPWEVKSDDRIDISEAKAVLEKDHYGLNKVKERILEYLAVKKITKSMQGPILCLVGPPGVGKTSIAKSVAKSMNRSYARISLGGVRDEAEIRGHRKTYIGAMPGRIIKAIKQANTKNPLILLDEIDKMTSDMRGDPSSALLEVLDSEQNKSFTDHYIEEPFDLSEVMFIATANTLETVPRPLLDRMEIVELAGYTAEEKLQIGKKHLLPKQMSAHGLQKTQLKVSDGAMRDVINYYTREAGVRELERQLARLCRKAALHIVENDEEAVSINCKNLTEKLGKHRFSYEKMQKENEVGVVTGLAWTQAGGDTLSIEVNVMKGSGKLELTGQLGDVMKESAMAAVSYVRANAEMYGIDEEFHEKTDIHIHVPEGATPKDGPSAGITIATALVSALSLKPVDKNVAMTGEITLRGRVLPIGGLKEKSLAAYRAGIKTILIPNENVKDIDEIDENVKNKLEIIPVKNVSQVLDIALLKEHYEN